jgi:hypothetical protein
MKLIEALILIVGGIGLAVLVSFLLSLPVMLLWDAVVPQIFTGLHEITWMQAWGLSLLCGLLFKSHTGSSK